MPHESTGGDAPFTGRPSISPPADFWEDFARTASRVARDTSDWFTTALGVLGVLVFLLCAAAIGDADTRPSSQHPATVYTPPPTINDTGQR